jgi:hypothetical protein
MRKLICCTNLSGDPPIFCRTICGPANYIGKVDDLCSGLVRSVEYQHSAWLASILSLALDIKVELGRRNIWDRTEFWLLACWPRKSLNALIKSGGVIVSTKFSTWIFGLSETSWSMASLLIFSHPFKLRYFKLRHEQAISLIVILLILQNLRLRCWSFGQERIILQIDSLKISVRYEMFRYSNLWHDCAIFHKPPSPTSRTRRLT